MYQEEWVSPCVLNGLIPLNYKMLLLITVILLSCLIIIFYFFIYTEKRKKKMPAGREVPAMNITYIVGWLRLTDLSHVEEWQRVKIVIETIKLIKASVSCLQFRGLGCISMFQNDVLKSLDQHHLGVWLGSDTNPRRRSHICPSHYTTIPYYSQSTIWVGKLPISNYQKK